MQALIRVTLLGACYFLSNPLCGIKEHLETIVSYRIDNDTLYCEKIEGSKVYLRKGEILIKYRDNAETH